MINDAVEEAYRSLMSSRVPELRVSADPLKGQLRLMQAMDRRSNELAGRYDAEQVFDHLRSEIVLFEAQLKDNQEIALQLANFGVAAQVHIRSISYSNPNLIEFAGVLEDGSEAKLVQHISQLNFLMLAVSPLQDEQPYRVGFVGNP